MNWTFRKQWTREKFTEKYGRRVGRFARIPYASSFNFEEEEYHISDWMKGWAATVQSMESKFKARDWQRVAHEKRDSTATCDADGHCEDHTAPTPPPVPASEHLHNSSSGTPTYLFSAEFTAHNPGIKRDGCVCCVRPPPPSNRNSSCCRLRAECCVLGSFASCFSTFFCAASFVVCFVIYLPCARCLLLAAKMRLIFSRQQLSWKTKKFTLTCSFTWGPLGQEARTIGMGQL